MKYTNLYGLTNDLENLPPSAQGLSPSYTTGTLSWTRGDGEYCLVIISARPVTFKPFNNITYPINTFLGGSQRVAYRGSGNSVDLDLQVGFIYFVKIFEFNGKASNEVYNVSGLSASFTVDGSTAWQWRSGLDVEWESGLKVELESA